MVWWLGTLGLYNKGGEWELVIDFFGAPCGGSATVELTLRCVDFLGFRVSGRFRISSIVDYFRSSTYHSQLPSGRKIYY